MGITTILTSIIPAIAPLVRPEPQGIPTRRSVRRLLHAVLPTDSEFDALCVDYFVDLYRAFTQGMDRTQKANVLLASESTTAVLKALRDGHLQRVEKHVAMLEFEATDRAASR